MTDRVAAASGAGEKEMQSLGKAALSIGQHSLFSVREGALAMEVLARNGLRATDIASGAAKAASEISIATATGEQKPADNLEAAADIVTDAMVQFHIGADEMSKAGDKITGFTLESKGKLNDFYPCLLYTSPSPRDS